MYLLYLCKTQVSQRSSIIDDGSPLILFPSQMYYPCTFCTCAKHKSVNGSPLIACLRSLHYTLLRCTTHVPFVLVCKIQVSQWFSADSLPPQSSLYPSQMYYPCTFCTCAKHKSVSQRSSTIDDGSPLILFPSQMYYPCTFCTCAKHKSVSGRQPSTMVLR